METNDPNAEEPGRDDLADLIASMDVTTRRKFLEQVGATGLALAFSSLFFNYSGPVALGAEAPASVPGATGVETADVTLKINGKAYALKVDPRTTLLDALRDRLDFTGTKKGCDHGQCGACTVLVNGRRINSCLSMAVVHHGDEVTTVEGLASGTELHPVQAAFIKHDGFQCGYCTPGQICSAVALLKEGHAKSDNEIREWMSGNICRCGAYPNIVAAIREAQKNKAIQAS